MNYQDPLYNPVLNQYLSSLKRPAKFFDSNNSAFYNENNFGLLLDNVLQGLNSCIIALQFLDKYPLKFLGVDYTICNFELYRIRKELDGERLKFIGSIHLNTPSINQQEFIARSKLEHYSAKRNESRQNYKINYHSANCANRVKQTDPYTNVTRPLTPISPPQNLLASTFGSHLVARTSAPALSTIDQIKHENSLFFQQMNTNLNPSPTDNYQLFPKTSQIPAEKPAQSVTFSSSIPITTTAEIHEF